jgi:hypothetical protein
MSKCFREGDFVIIEDHAGHCELGLIVRYHSRGECELGLGLAWLKSGHFKQLPLNFNNKLFGNSIHSFEEGRSLVKDDSSYKIVKRYLSGDSRVVKKPKVGSTIDVTVCYGKDIPPEDFTRRGEKDQPFQGGLDIPRKYNTLHSIISEIESRNFIMQRKLNQEFLSDLNMRKFLKDALKSRTEGVWMNPSVSIACLKYFGIPASYFRTGRKLVSSYNQLIIQVDGTDTARTLGMHKDRDDSDKEVNTVLGCVAAEGNGKDIILWRAKSVEEMPRWWRNEGLGREAFAFALFQCSHVNEIRRNVSLITLSPGQFVYMPKGTWHWVCPSEGVRWTCMLTSSFY